MACMEFFVSLRETLIHCVSPGTALFLLCLALHQESRQPLSENKGTPGERDNKKNKTRLDLLKSLCTTRLLINQLVLTESPVLADTN